MFEYSVPSLGQAKYCQGMRSETSTYPVFEVILRKALEKPLVAERNTRQTGENYSVSCLQSNP